MSERAVSFNNRGALQLIEEAVHLLRRYPAQLLGIYFLGSCPFVIALLYFWADMSRSAYAAAHCAIAALGLALLFVWMKTWQAVFAGQVTTCLHNGETDHFSRWHLLKVASVQAFIQATGIIVLPLAALVMLPFGWCFAFYQNATVLGCPQADSAVSLVRSAWRQSQLWPRQNHQLLGVTSLFSVVVLLNVAIVTFGLPHLLKTFFGWDSIFTLSGANAINTTFWAACFSISYLCVDPLVKTAYALRCFYGDALTTGADLKVSLRRLNSVAPSALSTILAGVFLLLGQADPALAGSKPAVSPQELDQSVSEVLKQPHFTWRMAREKAPEEKQTNTGPLDDAIEWVVDKIKQGLRTVAGWVKDLGEWLSDLLPHKAPRPEPPPSGWRDTLRAVLIVFIIALGGLLGFILWRSWLRHATTDALLDADDMPASPNLDDADITADVYPADRWMAIGSDLIAKSDLRMALRAFYLATLAHLATHDWITIQPHKTHRDYLRELERRVRDNPVLTSDFHQCGAVYERVWYGMRQIAAEEFNRFATIQKRVMTIAEA